MFSIIIYGIEFMPIFFYMVMRGKGEAKGNILIGLSSD
jgi:hypothetical protein